VVELVYQQSEDQITLARANDSMKKKSIIRMPEQTSLPKEGPDRDHVID
jgi:hypothetical protein